jgi:FemAB-related protein (PEP-CTERM system-associated)
MSIELASVPIAGGPAEQAATPLVVTVIGPGPVRPSLDDWRRFANGLPPRPIGADPRWLAVLADGLGHLPYCLEARRDGRLCGLLPLALVRGPLFGRFLVSLPFVSSCGVLAEDAEAVARLVDRAMTLADELNVKHLELRSELPLENSRLDASPASKVQMRRPLPATVETLWKDLDSKVRNQIRKGEKQAFEIQWGHAELLEPFYRVFSRNMRDLGTPVFGRRLFAAILRHFGDDAELCIVRLNGRPIAAALLIHGEHITEVPCASSLREFNATNANMFLYWQLLKRAIARGSATFDFGRSTAGSGTERFKAQWDAVATPAAWQCYFRRRRSDLRKESPVFAALARAWQYLPVSVAELVGPTIVRGLP